MVNKMKKGEQLPKEKEIKKEKRKVEKEKPKDRFLKLKGLIKPRKKIEEKAPALIEDPFTILKFVLMTEKAIQLIEKENKLVFIVDRKCSKNDTKRAAESAFQAAVKDVKTSIDQKGRKKAFVRFREAGVAGEIAMRLGII